MPWKRLCGWSTGIENISHINQSHLQWMIRWRYTSEAIPSTSGGARSSGLLLMSMAAFPRIKLMDMRWKSCLDATFSSHPWCRARAASILFICSVASGHPVEASQRFHSNRKEGDPLVLASLCSALHLAIESLV